MIKFQPRESGWLTALISEAVEDEAKQIRQQRDQQYRNLFVEKPEDMRWVGEIGEIALNSWLKITGVPFRWVREHAAGMPDFVVKNMLVGLKTVKRQGPVRPDYTAQITAKHAKEPADFFLFASYEYPERRLWFLGGIRRANFLEHARYYSAGEAVHANYVIRPGHEIYNLPIQALVTPVDWLQALRQKAQAI